MNVGSDGLDAGSFGVSEEVDSGVKVDQFGIFGQGAEVGIGFSGAVEEDLAGDDGPVDGESLVADGGAKGGSAEAAIDAGIDDFVGDEPRIDILDGLVDVDVAVLSIDNDLRDASVAIAVGGAGADVGRDVDVAVRIVDDKWVATSLKCFSSDSASGGVVVGVGEVVTTEFGFEVFRINRDGGVAKDNRAVAVGVTICVGDSNGGYRAVAIARSGVARDEGGARSSAVDGAVGDDSEVAPRAENFFYVVDFGLSDGSSGTAVSEDGATPSLEVRIFANIEAGGIGDCPFAAKVEAVTTVSGLDADGDAELLVGAE